MKNLKIKFFTGVKINKNLKFTQKLTIFKSTPSVTSEFRIIFVGRFKC